ncbi:ATP-binding cassette domain-containing protein [Kitasatospora sp. NBC_00315]|uniref:ABC transporter ATP-binding protein n=1 Tax=Kitasatospora sp. NBC_00315 TaxID=2975963 RepID=UPI0032493303
MSTLIEARDVGKSFRLRRRGSPGLRGLFRTTSYERVAVDGVGFSVAAGERVGLLGPNGAGKSTLIKMLTGVVVPTAGEVRILGRRPHEDRLAVSQEIGVVFGQRTQLWWDLPVIDSLKVLRDIYRTEGSTFTRRLRQFDDLLELSAFWDTPVRQLSLGQRVRADLAAALVHGPRLLFLDEPTIGLDVIVKEQVRRLLAEFTAEGEKSVLVTTHDMSDVERVCERVLLIDKGRLLFDGDLDSLRKMVGATRLVRVVFASPEPDPVLAGAAALTSEALRATFLLPESMRAGEAILDLTRRYDVSDVSVSEVPLEDVMRQYYSSPSRGPGRTVGSGDE